MFSIKKGKQQWEYIMLRSIPKPVPDLKHRIFIELGLDGWELVSVVPAQENEREFYFKRPKSSPF